MKKNPVLVKKYNNILKYLQDYFNYRKSTDKKFSYDTWVAELGFKSHSYMSMLCKDKRAITPQFISVFSKKMCFSSSEEKHMTLLADYSRAKTDSQKKMYLEKITESLDSEDILYDIKNYAQFLSAPSALVLLLLISFDGIIATTTNLKNLLELPH